MFQYQGIWLPDGEDHLTGMLDRGPFLNKKGTYQYKKYLAVLAKTPNRRTVIDIGAHVGLWSMNFVRDFNHVEAFEPCLEHRECFVKNLLNAPNVVMHHAACGEEEGIVHMRTNPTSSGDTWPETPEENPEGEPAPVVRIDACDIKQVDLIKADCEGYELFALQGAEETIRECKPTIIVEQKPGRAQKFGLNQTQAVTYLEGLGMRLATVISGDFILVW